MENVQLEDRLARLEAENRRLRRFGLGALIGLGSLTLMSFAAPTICHTVWAERFVLRDGSNKSRLTINAYGTDTPSIAFHDRKGKEIGSLGLTTDGTFKVEVVENGRRKPASFQLDENGALRLAAAQTREAPKRKLKGEGIN